MKCLNTQASFWFGYVLESLGTDVTYPHPLKAGDLSQMKFVVLAPKAVSKYSIPTHLQANDKS